MSANKWGDIVKIDDRKIKILQAIISDYINTAEPVGSRTIAKKYDLGISSATIRNEMADLEEMGYLEQIHTSSGRKPSDKGYRLYVDKIMTREPVSLDEEIMIKGHLIDCALFEVDRVLKQAIVLLSDLTKLTCVLDTPAMNKSYIKALQLINIDENSILVVIVTDSGIIKNSMIRVKKTPDSKVLQRMTIALNERIKNLTIEQINLEVINNLKNDLKGYDDIFNAIVPALYDTLKESSNTDIYTEGATNIFNYPEYNDIDKAREFLSLVNSKDDMKNLLNLGEGISIRIGEENFLPGARECSVISASYNMGGEPLGTIGIIGPTRIPYSKVISIMAKVMKELNDVLKHQSDY